MSKQEFMKVQTFVLRVNIHCDGCKLKVRKLLQKIDGVYSVSIDAEQGKVAVSGCVDPARLIKKLEKSGKHAELWGVQKGGSNHHNQVQFMNNQFKNMNIGNDKNKTHKGGGGKDQQPKSVQVQHVKGANKDMMKKAQQPNGKDQKSVKFNLPDREEFDMSDHEFDDFGDDFDDEFDDDDDDDEYDDEEGEEFGHGHGHGHGHHLPNKVMMPNKVNMMQGNGNGPHGPYREMMPIMGSNHGPFGPKGGGGGGGGGLGGGVKKGGVIDFPVAVKGGKGSGNKEGKGGVIDFPIEMKGKGNGNKEGKNGIGGKKEGKGGGVCGSGKKMNGGEKNEVKKKKKGGLRGLFGFGKKSSSKGGSVSKKGSNNNGSMSGEEKKKGHGKKGEGNYKKHESNKMKNDFEIDITSGHGKGGKGGGGGGGKMGQLGDMDRVGGSLFQMGMGPMGHGGNGGIMGQMGMGPMGGYPMGPMGGFPAVEGLPAQAMMNGQYYQGMGPGPAHGPPNPYSQQQYMAMMMNQQRGNGNDMFQPMMYSRPHPAVNYAAPVPPHPSTDSYTHFFSDENTESCNIM